MVNSHYLNEKPKMNGALYLFAIHLILVFLSGFVEFSSILINIFQYLFIALGFLKILMKGTIKSNLYLKWGIAFIVVMLASLSYCPSISEATKTSILPFSIQFSIFISIIAFVDDEHDLKKVLDIYSFAGWIFLAVVFFMYSKDLFSGRRFGYSLGKNPNEIMLQLMIPANIFCYRAFKDRVINIKNLIGYILSVLVMFSTGSKKSLLIVLFAALYILFKQEKNKFKMILTIVVIVLAGYYAVFNVEFLYDALGQRLEDLLSSSQGGESSSQTDIARFMMREKAFQMFLESPIIGQGSEAFRVLSGYNTYSHNNYVEMLSSYGIIGTCVYYSLPIIVLVRSLRSNFYSATKNPSLCFIAAALITYFFIDWGAVTTYIKYNMGLFMIVSLILENHRKEIV